MVTQNAPLSMENAMSDSIPGYALTPIDIKLRLVIQGKGATSDGSIASVKDLQDIMLKLSAAPDSTFNIDNLPSEKEIDRFSKLHELRGLEMQKQMLDQMDYHWRNLMERREQSLAVPPEPAQSVTGDEAKRVWEMGRQNAREGGHFGFPPPEDATYILIAEGFQYNIRGDGKITRQKEGVSTPEQDAAIRAEMNASRAMRDIYAPARAAQYNEIESRMTSLKAELGITDDSWRNELETRNIFSTAV